MVVVDDDTVIREGLPSLIPQLRVHMAVSSVEELLAAQPETGVVLLDLACARERSRSMPLREPGTGC